MTNQEEKKTKKKENKNIFSALNRFKYGFYSGLIIGILALGGIGHLVLNVFKIGSVTIADRSFGEVGSPDSTVDEVDAQADKGSRIEQNNAEVNDSENTNQAIGGSVIEENTNKVESGDAISESPISGETVSVTINYNNNTELPGFNADNGYTEQPPDIGQFNDAILITNVSLGSEYARFETREVFINKRKYKSTFSLVPENELATRVSFNLETPGIKPDGVFLQFGLADLNSGTTTLTYLVDIYGNGEIMWSNQIKYEESQIASVVLDTSNVEDIVVEYQIVETAGVVSYRLDDYPLFFTEAKVLEN